MLIEYRVREVTRYYVTRFEDDGKGRAGSSSFGEYGNPETAYEVGYALCKAEHERLGFPPDDERIQYPRPIFSGEAKRLAEIARHNGSIPTVS